MHRILKIGFVLDDTLDTPDGVQQYVLTLGDWLSKQGHEVHYLVGETYRTDVSNVHSMAKNVKVSFNKNKLSIPLPTKKSAIAAKLKELQLDVLHIQMPYSPLFAGRVISAAPKATKVVGTFHIIPASWLEKTGARSLQLITKKTLRRFDAIVSVSNAAQQFAKTIFGIDSIVIPNTVNIDKFVHKPTYTDTLHVVFLGRLVERKGCEYFLKALNELKKIDVNNYKVTIAGKGPLLAKLQKYTKEHKLSTVTFAGFVSEEDKPALLSSADIAVFPSTGGESFGIVLIEAMAAGARVVIGGDNVGYRSVLGTYENLLVRPQDTKVFAKRLQYYLTNEKARKDAHEWLQSQVVQYDTTTVGGKVLNIYKNLLA